MKEESACGDHFASSEGEHLDIDITDLLEWVPHKLGDQIPEGAIHVGYDHLSSIVVARAEHEGDMIPGKLVLDNPQKCYISWGGLEYEKSVFEVLCRRPKMCVKLFWEPIQEGTKYLPIDAYPAGKTKHGSTLFIGRVFYNNTTQAGKVPLSETIKKCYIPYGGRELVFHSFQILISRYDAKISC